MDGYIKLYRSFVDWEWYSDVPVKTLFIHCLLLANYTEKQWRGEEIPAGTFVTSIKKLTECGLSEQQIRTALNKLEKTQEIKKATSNKHTIITVNNYKKWQCVLDMQQTDNTQVTINQQSNNNQITTTKKEKKERRKEIDNKYTPVIELFSSVCPDLPKPKQLTDNRKRMIKNADAQLSGLETDFTALFTKVQKSDFLSGRNGAWTGCNFDWILKPSNVVKIIEGNYDNKDKVTTKSKTGKMEREASYDIDELERSSFFE